MAFELYQLHLLMQAKEGNTEVAPIPEAVSRHLGCRQRMAYLSSDSIRHIFDKHPDLDLFELLHMPDMVRHGLWLTDHKNSQVAMVIYEPPNAPRYMSALKVVGNGFEPFMCSFYRLRDKDLLRKMKRGDVLRPHLR